MSLPSTASRLVVCGLLPATNRRLSVAATSFDDWHEVDPVISSPVVVQNFACLYN